MNSNDIHLFGIHVGRVDRFHKPQLVIATGFYPHGRRNTHHDTVDEAVAAVTRDANAFFASVIRAAVESP